MMDCGCGCLNTILMGLVLFAALFYLFFRRRFTYWDKKGIPTLAPTIPFGNVKEMLKKKITFGEVFNLAYDETKEHPYVGMYMFHTPTLLVNDLDAVKNVLTKDFVHFSDHGLPFDEERDPLAGHLFNASGVKWRNLRAKLTPTFTSSKMRMMFDTVAACAIEMADHTSQDVVDLKDLMGRFATDVIANCAFGVECNSIKNPDERFRTMGKRIFQPTACESILALIDFFIPKLTAMLKIKMVAKDIEQFFYGMVEETVRHREENQIFRNDFMQLLIQLKNNGAVHDERENVADGDAPNDGTTLTMMQLAAQVFVFFIAGFDTSSSTASFALYELALNPDIQKNLIDEIDEVLANNGGKITYDSLAEMTYLTKVIEETLRKYPALPILLRSCTKEYKIPDSDVVIEKGTPVMIPIRAIQNDQQYFPNPNAFDPERFSAENKASRHHFSYIPFGEGPRICIGNRFGMMQTKLGLATFLSKFEVSVCEKTPIPIVYDWNSLILQPEGGLWLKVEKRNTKRT